MSEKESADDKRTDRRSYLRRLVLGAIGTLALASAFRARETPQVHSGDGDNLRIGIENSGTSTTTLTMTNPSYNAMRFNGSIRVESPSQCVTVNADGAASLGLFAFGTHHGIEGNSTSGSGIIGSSSPPCSFATESIGMQGLAGGTGIAVMGKASAASAKPLVARGYAAQSANLQEWQDSGGTVLSAVNSAGRLAVGHSAPSYMFDLRTPASSTAQMHVASTNTDAGGYLISANDGNLFMAGGANYSGSGTSWTAKATSAYLFGGGAAGVRFYHDTGLAPGGSYTPTARMWIGASGSVGIGTESPTDMLDVNGNAIRVRTSKTPASATDTGNAGEICWDSNYVYVCVAANTWKRAALNTW